jgi:hypothetical protein
MIRAACHCEAVKFEIAEPPAWVLDCNCTLCRRYGALWTYFRGADQAKLLRTPDAASTDTYLWGDREIAFHRCRTCGCVTHISAVTSGAVFGVNARMMAALDPATVVVRQIDNSHSGFFWTASPNPPIESRHPPMPKPGPEDWR